MEYKFFISLFLLFLFNSMVTNIRSSFALKKFNYKNNQRDLIKINDNNLYSKSDHLLVQTFIRTLKSLRGDWTKNGIQRLIRLNSECSNKYISLRNLNIKADIPIYEAFKDPYSKYFLSYYVI